MKRPAAAARPPPPAHPPARSHRPRARPSCPAPCWATTSARAGRAARAPARVRLRTATVRRRGRARRARPRAARRSTRPGRAVPALRRGRIAAPREPRPARRMRRAHHLQAPGARGGRVVAIGGGRQRDLAVRAVVLMRHPGGDAPDEFARAGRDHDAPGRHAMQRREPRAQGRVGRIGIARRIGRAHLRERLRATGRRRWHWSRNRARARRAHRGRRGSG